ncbi:MAG TPA: phosphate ABC transporter permease subunit PstC [Solirubrobacterales bacterium]|nr:phosphate ABC transporter permease subunit PstC [Solirubrobacterales bacterium]
MSVAASTAVREAGHGHRVSPLRKRADQLGDRMLFGICVLAALIAAAAIVLVGYQIIHGASPAISKFGIGFVYETTWQPNFGEFGAGVLLFGTAVTSAFALLLGAPIAVAIGLFLTLLAPGHVRSVIGPLVELLAAIPSVILGFWGLLVLAPFVHEHIEPFLHGAFGFIPIFGDPQTTGLSFFTAGLILTLMVIPIIASISRDLFQSVPPELQDGAAALGATRWEVVRGIVLPTTSSGVIAASILGLGRALGEAIAVSQVIGAGFEIKNSLFETGNTLAAQIALQFPGALTELHKASLYYCGVMLLVIGIAANLLAQWIGRRFGYAGAVAR